MQTNMPYAHTHIHTHAKRLFLSTFLFSDQVMTPADWLNKKKYLFKSMYIKTEKLTWGTTNLFFSYYNLHIYIYISMYLETPTSDRSNRRTLSCVLIQRREKK